MTRQFQWRYGSGIKKWNKALLLRSTNKLFTVENTYDTVQTDKAKAINLRREGAIISELTRKHECLMFEPWDGEESLNITNVNLLIGFNMTPEIFRSVSQVLSILQTTAATTIVGRANSKEREG